MKHLDLMQLSAFYADSIISSRILQTYMQKNIYTYIYTQYKAE